MKARENPTNAVCAGLFFFEVELSILAITLISSLSRLTVTTKDLRQDATPLSV
jgi:hypothetical protein